ncbi:MAG: NAD(P)/FAD-dependent oxidoreductase [Haloarculaceae archaeon]
MRVAVVGAGVVGCAVARELAADHEVCVLDRAGVGEGTTARSAGKVTMTPAYPDRPAVAAHATAFFERRAAYVPRESVELVPPDREGEARRRVDRLADEGLDVRFLDADATAATYPRLALGEHCGVVRHEGTGYLDAAALTDALAAEARERGARFRTDTAVREFDVESGAVRGVLTDEGRVPADAVVVAAGWRTPDLVDDHLTLPVRPYRTQCVRYRLDAPARGFPQGGVPEAGVYFRPADAGERLLVGGWAEPVADPAGASRDCDAAFRDHARGVVPSLLDPGSGAIEAGWAGVDCGTPDARPVVDAPAEGPDGLVVATGFHGRGVMTAPVAATAVRSLLADEPAPFSTDAFALSRFADRSPDFDFLEIGRDTGRE